MDDHTLRELMQECVVKKRQPAPILPSSVPPKKQDFEKRRREAKRAAYELGYSRDIIERIEQAKNETQISNALAEGRHRLLEKSPLNDILRKKRK